MTLVNYRDRTASCFELSEKKTKPKALKGKHFFFIKDSTPKQKNLKSHWPWQKENYSPWPFSVIAKIFNVQNVKLTSSKNRFEIHRSAFIFPASILENWVFTLLVVMCSFFNFLNFWSHLLEFGCKWIKIT